ncbi:MAG: DUF6273 domain-containing protein, partial [Clostridia bacterium]|nr:DUF6273 domain-containing protein [Clostridia bacterium]
VGEGTQYAFWVSTANKIKRLSNGSGDTHLWWLRSPYIVGNDAFRCFNSSGDITNYSASYTNGVSFGFCV